MNFTYYEVFTLFTSKEIAMLQFWQQTQTVVMQYTLLSGVCVYEYIAKFYVLNKAQIGFL